MVLDAQLQEFSSLATRGSDRIPITILTGFLGSGKTTVLSQALSDPHLKNVAIVVNEFAALGIDHLVVAAPDTNTRLLAGNCLCCLPRDEWASTLRDIRNSSDVDTAISRVIVETSGLADPVPVLRSVVSDPGVAQDFRLDAVVTTIDSVNGSATLYQHASAVNQVAMADSILVTKSDLVDDDAYQYLASHIRRLNPWARQYRDVHGFVVEQDDRAGPHSISGESSNGAIAWITRRELGAEARWISNDFCRGEGYAYVDRTHHRHLHEDGIETFMLTRESPVRNAGLQLWIDMLMAHRGPSLLRVKGLLNVEGCPVTIHAAQRIVHPPISLSKWPTSDRTSRIVFITRGISKESLERSLSAFDFAMEEPGLSSDNYGRFIAAMQRIRG